MDDFEFILSTLPTHASNMPIVLFWSHGPVLYILLVSATENQQSSQLLGILRFLLSVENYRMVISSPNV